METDWKLGFLPLLKERWDREKTADTSQSVLNLCHGGINSAVGVRERQAAISTWGVREGYSQKLILKNDGGVFQVESEKEGF